MGKKSILFSKIVVYLLGVIGVLLCVLLFPWLNHYANAIQPAFLKWQYPIFIGICLTLIPFFIALFDTIRLLSYIEQNIAFSQSSVQSLKRIKYCAIVISLMYTIGLALLIIQSDLYPEVAVIGLPILITTIVVSVLSAVLEGLFNNALEIKSENDLTI